MTKLRLHNMSAENKLYFQAEKEAIFLLLTGIGDEIYLTIDACNTANEMWIAIERLQQGESFCSGNLGTERIAKSENPLALLAAAQPYSDNYYQAPKPQRTNTTSSSTRPSASRHKGKEIAKPVTPQSELVSEEDSSTNLPTTTIELLPRETVGSPVVQQNGIQCFNCKGFDNYAKECRKPKRVKDYTHHKEKMMMCKQAEQGVPLQEVLPKESSSTKQPLEQVQNNDENNVFANERKYFENNTAECADERVALANLIANLTLDTEENKTILKQLKKANASLTQELEECKTNLDETSRALGEATSCQDSCLIALQNELEKYIAFNDRTIDYEILQTKLNDTLGLLALKDIDIKEGLKTKAYEILVVNQKHDELVKRSLLTKSQFEGQLKEKSKVISDLKVKEEKDIDKMIKMDKQLKFLNEIV
ncbi:hypothetical protein Tco_0334979, partial [Tanacetum coccineum]